MSTWPKNIILRKLSTLPHAPYPQEEKYPDNTEWRGLMWEFSRPKVGEPFVVKTSKLFGNYHTSTVLEVFETEPNKILFRTLNSNYELIID